MLKGNSDCDGGRTQMDGKMQQAQADPQWGKPPVQAAGAKCPDSR